MANGGFRDDDLFEINMALRCEVKALEHTVQEFKNGARYKKLQEDYHRVCVGYQKEIQKLKIELGKANATIISVRNIWFDQLEEVYKKDQKEPPNLRGNVQYGSTVQAMILSMTNNINAAMNKTAMFIKGIALFVVVFP